MSRRALVLFILFFVTGCSTKGCGKVSPQPDPSNDPPVLVDTTNGLVGAERGRWWHLAEGSELYPLSWLLALENPDTGKPFLDNIERFGLLPDSKSDENPYVLPVGLTAAYTRDLRFAGVQMVGVNCAACHVGEFHLNNAPVIRIDGAPNLFDFELYLTKLAEASEKTLTDPETTWRFVRKLFEVYNPSSSARAALARLPTAADAVVRSFDSLKTMKEGPLGKQIAEQIEAIHKAEIKRPAIDLNKGLVVRPAGPALQSYSQMLGKGTVKHSTELKDAARDLLLKTIGKLPALDSMKLAQVQTTRVTPLSKLSATERASSISDVFDHFTETIRLLKARAEFLVGLAQSKMVHTTPGFGRVDAFGSARNRFFPTDPKPTTAPVSYPYLWDLNQLNWLHWDADTTSLLERNAGQAIGLGALYDPATFDSTLIIDNLTSLETLARKITPPKWPEKFGAIDLDKAARGKTLFAANCIRCHKPVAAGETVSDDLLKLDEIGTDRMRAENFALPVNGTPFNVALSDILKKLVRKAGGTTPDENLWRVTRQYPDRPLKAIWATAPYLHNNSVPTLYDLLLPAAKRPSNFPVGHREYDPVKLGYTSKAGTPTFPYETKQTGNTNIGNDNSGHEYGTNITDPERMDLLEYLKTI